MKVLITKRVSRAIRVGDYSPKHFATGVTYAEDEIEEERVFDIPDAYKNEGGICWDGQHILAHPEIIKWAKKRR